MTAPEIGGDEWTRTVTASKVPAILGLSKWTGPAETWLTMRGEVQRDSAPTDVQQRGHDLEPMALRKFWESKRHPGRVQETGEISVTRDDLGFPAAASPDSSGREDGVRIFCEAKSVGNFDAAKAWGEQGTDEVPLDYFVQVMWQMHMTQLDAEPVTTTYVSVVGPVLDDHAVYVVRYDAELAATITARILAFYLSLEDDDACPPADALPSTLRVFAKRNPEVDKDAEWEIDAQLAHDFVKAHADVDEATDRLTMAKGEIARRMGKARIAYVAVPDGKLPVARRQKQGKGIAVRCLEPDLDALAALIPEVDPFTTTDTASAAA